MRERLDSAALEITGAGVCEMSAAAWSPSPLLELGMTGGHQNGHQVCGQGAVRRGLLLPDRLAGPGGAERHTGLERLAAHGQAVPGLGLDALCLFDRGSYGGIYYLVMEFVTGPSLRETMTTGAHGPDLAFDVTAQVLSAMDYAHRHGDLSSMLRIEALLDRR